MRSLLFPSRKWKTLAVTRSDLLTVSRAILQNLDAEDVRIDREDQSVEGSVECV